MLPRKVTISACLRSFQYKILNNIFDLNKKLYTFGLSNIHLFSFCKMEEERISHLFYHLTHIQDIWNQVQAYSTCCLHFLPQTAIFLVFIILIMTLFLFKIIYYFYSNYIYTIPENTGFYLLTIL